ncbi:MAG: aldo/keto reductase [Rikenellaceae bacterium]
MMKQNINRREFLKIVGISAATVGVASTIGCKGKNLNSTGRGGTSNTEVPKGQITCKKVAGTDDDLSILAYGCMRWPTKEGVQKGENVVDQDAVNELVDYAIEHGVNYFDTAPIYCQGWSEEATGNALSRYPRESYYIATKMSNKTTYDLEFGINMYKSSLKKLQTDYIDYYLLHNVGSDMQSFRSRFLDNGLLDYLLEERKAGRIRKLGWSFHGEAAVFDEILAMHDEVHWDFIQIQLNYTDWRNAAFTFVNNVNAEYLYNEIAKKNIPVAVMEPLLGGRLSSVPDHIFTRLKEREPESSVASWAFRFAGSKPLVYTVLSGMVYLEHLQDNIRTYSPLKPLTEEEEEFLDETANLLIQYPTVACNDCKYCMPCPYGVDIPAILIHYNKCVNEGNISNTRQDENYKKARQAYLVGYDRAVPKLRQAKKCIGCNQCTPYCPQRIDIPAQLSRIDQYIEKLKQETL